MTLPDVTLPPTCPRCSSRFVWDDRDGLCFYCWILDDSNDESVPCVDGAGDES